MQGGDGGQRRVEGHPRLIAVGTELATKYLIDHVFERVMERFPGEIPPPTAGALEGALESVVGAERAEAASPGVGELAAKLARAGYLTRIVETEMFEPARAATPGLTDALREAFPSVRASWPDAIAGVSAELARREPFARPRPDDGRAMSWRIGGPGGHVRHYLAVRSARNMVSGGPGGRPELPRGVEDLGELKRCWLYGFFLRCCEESLPPEASLK